jgi:hypothetical protein
MSLSVSITDPPSGEGSTQTRTVGVSLQTASRAANITVTLAVDGSQDGSFRLVKSKSRRYDANQRVSLTFESFIGAQPPYDVRVTASGSLPSGDVEAKDTVTVNDPSTATGQGSQSQPQTLDGPDDPDGDDFVGTTLTEDDRNASYGAASVTPRIGTVEPITQRVRIQQPWQRDSNVTQCGRILQTQRGAKDKRITIEGVMTLRQWRRLDRQRTGEYVEVRDPVLGRRRTVEVAFDQINVERTDADETITVNGQEQVAVPFQIQTKENDTDSFGDESIDAQAFEDTDN